MNIHVYGGPFSGKTVLVDEVREFLRLKVVELDEFLSTKGLHISGIWRPEHPRNAEFRQALDEFNEQRAKPADGATVFISHDPPRTVGERDLIIALRPSEHTLAERIIDWIEGGGDANRISAAIHWMRKGYLRDDFLAAGRPVTFVESADAALAAIKTAIEEGQES